MSPPVVQEYEVGPLPRPTFYEPIRRSQWRDPIPYTARPYSTQMDGALWHEFICRQLTTVDSILREVTGGWSYSPDCRHRCLTYRCHVVRTQCGLLNAEPVSYTHLTLPTNREV